MSGVLNQCVGKRRERLQCSFITTAEQHIHSMEGIRDVLKVWYRAVQYIKCVIIIIIITISVLQRSACITVTLWSSDALNQTFQTWFIPPFSLDLFSPDVVFVDSLILT